MHNSERQEELFQSHIANEKISAARTLSILGSLLYLAFGVVDIYSLSITLPEVLAIRGAVLFVMISSIAISYLKSFPKYYDLTIAAVYLSATAGINAMIYLALPGDHAANVYFAGLILVIMTVFSWAYFKGTTSLIVISSILASYAYVEMIKGMPIPSLLVNMFFLISACSIGFLSQLIRDRYIRENFELQQSLKEAVEEKTIEAKDNAYLANHDALTLLPNRRYITELLEESLQIAKEKDKVLAILFLDLNGFKQINDRYGHAVGDEVLIIVAKRLELAIRRGDYISRLSGDEYLVSLMMDKENLSEIKKMAAKFTAIISEPMNIDGTNIKVGVSIGISAYPMHGNKISVLMDIADKKMYQVKQGLQEVARNRENNSIPTSPSIESLDLLPSHSK
jgi:diguanylate cyclase (GGDEF)-like protein